MLALNRLLRSVRRDDGFGLVELLIALTILVIGILAIVAGFSSGMLALKRASHASAAGALADQRMEQLRGGTWADLKGQLTCSSSVTAVCDDTEPDVGGPDGHKYTVTSSYSWTCALGSLTGTMTEPSCGSSAMPTIRVTIVVRDPSDDNHVVIRETSTFDRALMG